MPEVFIDGCRMCGAPDSDQHAESCFLYAPPTTYTKEERKAYRLAQARKAADASPREVLIWAKKHANSMTPTSPGWHYMQHVIDILTDTVANS